MPPDFFSPLWNETAPILRLSAWWAALAVPGLALLLGSLLTGALRPATALTRAFADRWLLRLALGLALLPPLVLIAGQFPRLVFRLPWSLPAAAGWLLLLADAIRCTRATRRFRNPAPAPPLSPSTSPLPPVPFAPWLDRAAWLLVALWLLAILGPAFSPPSNYDVLEYHLGYTTHVFATGLARPIPHVFYTAQPIATEHLYLLAAAVERTPWGYAPGALHWLLILAATLFVARAARALRLPPAVAPLLWLALLLHPTFLKLQFDRKTDFTGVLFLAAATWLWSTARSHPPSPPDPAHTPSSSPVSNFGFRISNFLTLGVLAAAALSAKWTHAGTVVLPVALMALDLATLPATQSQIPNLKSRISNLLIPAAAFLALFALVFAPWPLWLWFVAGNPVAPFAASLFPTPAWGPDQLDFLLATHGAVSPLSPAYWSNLASRLFLHLDPIGFPLLALGLLAAPLAVVFTPPRGPSSPRREPLLVLAALVLSILLWGQLLRAADRFLAPTFLLAILALALAARAILARLPARLPRAPLTLAVLAILAALPAAVSAPVPVTAVLGLKPAEYPFRYWPHALGRYSRMAYSWDAIGLVAPLCRAANALPPGSRLLAVNAAQRYHFAHPIALASVFDRHPIRPHLAAATLGRQSLGEGGSAPDLIARLRAAGFTHLLVNEYEQIRLLFMHTPPALAGDQGLQRLLALPPSDPTRAPQLIATYSAYTEFASDPLTPPERQTYLNLLATLRPQATYFDATPPTNTPALWIAPLQPQINVDHP